MIVKGSILLQLNLFQQVIYIQTNLEIGTWKQSSEYDHRHG